MAFGLAKDGPYAVTRARLAGYASVFGDVPVLEAGASSRTAAREVASSLRPRITAVLAMSDVLALGVLDARPELSVVGFDDIPEAQAGGLTTIRQNHRAKGRRAAQILLGAPATSVTLPYELIARRSARAPSA